MQQYTFNGFPTGNFSCAPVSGAQPQVVGEGDVAALALPDGSLQLYFVPACYPPGPVAWFIRTIPNIFPAQQPVLNHQFNIPNNHSQHQFWTQEKSAHLLKFHNDKATSSTDMHYFCKPAQTFHWDSQHETQVAQHIHQCPCKNNRQAGSAMSIDAFDEWNTLRLNLDKMEKVIKSVKLEQRATSEKSVQSVREQRSQTPCAWRQDDDGCSCP